MAEAFTCPITQEIIKDPVSSKYGHLYEKKAIEDWIEKNHKCPMTNNPLEQKDLYANFAVKSAIEQFVKLNDSINKGEIKYNSNVEESKDNQMPEQIQSMQQTMNKLRKDFVDSHKAEDLEQIVEANVEYEPGEKPKMKKRMLANPYWCFIPVRYPYVEGIYGMFVF